jgi:hypothetical protein
MVFILLNDVKQSHNYFSFITVLGLNVALTQSPILLSTGLERPEYDASALPFVDVEV